MGVFKSEKYIPIRSENLALAADDLMQHFRHQGFDVTGQETLTGGWDVSIHKGGLFKAVLGMKTALKVSVEPCPNGTLVKAGIGIFGQQVVPTVIMWYLFWPVMLTQLWGLVQQAKLDDEAISVVERSLSTRGTTEPTQGHTSVTPGSRDAARFCTECGATLPNDGKFCPKCGQPQ